MNKHTVKLTGIIKDDSWVPAKTHQAKEVKFFQGEDPNVGKLFIDLRDPFFPHLVTGKGKYHLIKRGILLIPAQEIPGVKIQVSLKKITGQLIYWA